MVSSKKRKTVRRYRYRRYKQHDEHRGRKHASSDSSSGNHSFRFGPRADVYGKTCRSV